MLIIGINKLMIKKIKKKKIHMGTMNKIIKVIIIIIKLLII